MPKISSSVEFSKSKEALGLIPALRQALDECYLLNNNSYTTCTVAENDLTGLQTKLGVVWAPKYFLGPTVTAAGGGADYVITIKNATDNANYITYTSATKATKGFGTYSKISN